VTEVVELEIEDRGEVVVARVSGELDIARAPGMGERIHESVPTSARALVVDFSELDFIDSSGIAMLFGLARRLGSRRQQVRVVARSGRTVARVLQIVEFDRAAQVHETLEAALEDLVTDS
jgi:anti-sigma B factor antagonist